MLGLKLSMVWMFLGVVMRMSRWTLCMLVLCRHRTVVAVELLAVSTGLMTR